MGHVWLSVFWSSDLFFGQNNINPGVGTFDVREKKGYLGWKWWNQLVALHTQLRHETGSSIANSLGANQMRFCGICKADGCSMGDGLCWPCKVKRDGV